MSYHLIFSKSRLAALMGSIVLAGLATGGSVAMAAQKKVLLRGSPGVPAVSG
jgi:hypothetical protein